MIRKIAITIFIATFFLLGTGLYVSVSIIKFVSMASLEALSENTRYISFTERNKMVVARSYERTITDTFVITAYSLNECGKSEHHPLYGVTASGYKLTAADSYKYVAVDNSKIKFGTRMIIHGPSGPIHVIAVDTGGGLQGKRLDLFISDDAEAWKWGRKTLKVTVFE